MSFKECRDSVTLTNDGLKLFGIYHYPDTEGPYPAILMCHGFAGTKIGRSRIYVRLSEMLAHAGIASLRIDFRGCGDSEGEFTQTTLHGKISDALLGLDFLKKQNKVDKNRLGILGRSLGGPISIIATRQFKAISCVALWAPLFTAKPWAKQWAEAQSTPTNDLIPENIVYFHGEFAGKKLFKQIFQLDLEDDLRAMSHLPLLHIASRSDEIIRLDQKEYYEKVREHAEAPTEFFEIVNSNHMFNNPFEQEEVLEKTLAFFKANLLSMNAFV